MVKRPADPLYEHNARPANTRTFGLSSLGTPLVSTSQVPITAAEPRQHPAPQYPIDMPMDIDEDFNLMEASDDDNHDLDVDEEVPPLPEDIAPGVTLRGIQKAKRYENSVNCS